MILNYFFTRLILINRFNLFFKTIEKLKETNDGEKIHFFMSKDYFLLSLVFGDVPFSRIYNIYAFS
jgi:hypothetical protein